MGSCISKCMPKREENYEGFEFVQDKLVISQAPTSMPSPTPQISTKKSPSSSPSPTISTFSSSSFTSTSITSSTSSSASSSSSSSSISSLKERSHSTLLKERSFSNDFLKSCVKEHPHIISTEKTKPRQGRQLGSPMAKSIVSPPQHRSPQRPVGSTPLKRARSNSNSPTLARQKSFRSEVDRSNLTYGVPNGNRVLRSPSPSRRFSGDNSSGVLRNAMKERNHKGAIGSKPIGADSTRRGNLTRPASPSNSWNYRQSCLRNRETERYTHHVGSKLDEISVAEVLSSQDADSVVMEDINNPLIALDCFIFL